MDGDGDAPMDTPGDFLLPDRMFLVRAGGDAWRNVSRTIYSRGDRNYVKRMRLPAPLLAGISGRGPVRSRTNFIVSSAL